MKILKFSVTGFYSPSQSHARGIAILFDAQSVQEAKVIGRDLLKKNAGDRYPDPDKRKDWETVFFHQIMKGENPGKDMGMTTGNYEIKSFASDRVSISPSIFFHALPSNAEETGRKILMTVNEAGYLSFANPEIRKDWASVFLKEVA